MNTSIASERPAGRDRPESALRLLPPEQQRLVRLFQKIRYGRIHRLRVRDGRADLAAGVPWTRTVKVHGENAPHPCSRETDFSLRREIVEFFRLLQSVGDGEITDIQVRDGLPFTFEVSGAYTP